MTKHLFFALTCLYSLGLNAQIQQNDTTICNNDSVVLNVVNSAVFQSCTGESPFNYSTWTPIAPTDSYMNIIKEGSNYYLRSQNNVYQSSALNGPWNSLGFDVQVGNTCAVRMLGFDWSNKLFIQTCHNDIYAYDNGTWVAKGLSGSGCGGTFMHKLANNRIIVMKGGFLRDLYISDDNGNNWTNVTNVDNDYWDMIVTPNGTIFSSGGSNTPSMTGLIKSTDNGSSFTQINNQLGISYCSGFAKDCDNNIYAVCDNKLFKTADNGNSWEMVCTIPAFFTANPNYSELVIASNGDFYLWGASNSGIVGFFKSSNLGQTWTQITDVPVTMTNVTDVKEIDGNIVVTTTQGIFAKTLNSNYSYLWSTGESTQSITVAPSITSTYSLQTTVNGSINNDSIVITIAPPSSSSQTQTALDSYTWPVNGQTYTQSGSYSDTLVNAAGCDSIVTLNLTMSYTGIEELNPTSSKKLIRITDLSGKETPFRKNTVLLFIYEDGTVERVFEGE